MAMARHHSLRRVANLTKKVHNDLKRGGMGMTFRYLFRTTAILSRVVAILADHVAEQAESEGRRAFAAGEPAPHRERVRTPR